jgi:hypothetical protein
MTILQNNFKKIIERSNLAEDLRAMWHEFITIADEQDLIGLIDMVQSNPDDLELLTKNLKQKVDAVKLNKGWDKILKEEKEFLEN